jgi:hypothetical protein
VTQLLGRLHSNDEVILGDVDLTEWFPGQFHATSRWGLVGLAVTTPTEGRWTGATVRVSGLDLVLGNAIVATRWPKDSSVSPRRYSADLTEKQFESSAGGVEVIASFDSSTTFADPYVFAVRNFATLRFSAPAGLSVDEWLHYWIAPLVDVLSVATGETEHVHSAELAFTPIVPPEGSMAQRTVGHLFGAGIRQDDPPATRRTGRGGHPVIPLFTLDQAPPLAELLTMAREDDEYRTAVALYRLALDRQLPTSVRYLLCVQAIESLQSASSQERERLEDDHHLQRRTDVLIGLNDVADEALDSEDKRFIKKFLAKAPHRSLGSRLKSVLDDVPDSAQRVPAWTERSNDLGAHLASLGRPGDSLHERLASSRNALSHGTSIPSHLLSPAVDIVLTLLRGTLLTRLGFTKAQCDVAFERMKAGS